jgi:hypothetical protein
MMALLNVAAMAYIAIAYWAFWLLVRTGPEHYSDVKGLPPRVAFIIGIVIGPPLWPIMLAIDLWSERGQDFG